MINFKDFPTTRYQGSKRRLLPWLHESIKNIEFEKVLDGFGGTGVVSYLFKNMGKEVHYNDILSSNYISGVALIENDSTVLSDSDLKFLLNNTESDTPTFISDTFRDIYYYQQENEWLDKIIFNINQLSIFYTGVTLQRKIALAYYSLFQACLSKRPFNLFHRKNLNLRENKVKQSFGNQKTWDTDFSELFIKFAQEISTKVYSNNKVNKAFCSDILDIENVDYDFIYLDPPYQRLNETNPKNYFSLYHFLEGILMYDNWSTQIDNNKKHKPLIKRPELNNKLTMLEILNNIIDKFIESKIMISYGKPGIPSVNELINMLKIHGKKVEVFEKPYSYKLNKRNGSNLCEVLILGV